MLWTTNPQKVNKHPIEKYAHMSKELRKKHSKGMFMKALLTAVAMGLFAWGATGLWWVGVLMVLWTIFTQWFLYKSITMWCMANMVLDFGTNMKTREEADALYKVLKRWFEEE